MSRPMSTSLRAEILAELTKHAQTASYLLDNLQTFKVTNPTDYAEMVSTLEEIPILIRALNKTISDDNELEHLRRTAIDRYAQTQPIIQSRIREYKATLASAEWAYEVINIHITPTNLVQINPDLVQAEIVKQLELDPSRPPAIPGLKFRRRKS